MILRNTNSRDSKLENEMTVGEFIKEIIEKDKERELKYYRITLKDNLHSKNMRLYYQDGILKSQHTTGSKMDYKDYINHEIWESYGCDYITVDNIWNYRCDFNAEDSNKPKKIENRRIDSKKLKETCDKVFEEIDRDREKRAKVDKVKWNHKCEEITFNDLVECVRQMAWDMDKLEGENGILRSNLNSLQEEKELLYNQIKWLEYKIDLLQKKNNNDYDDKYKNFDPERFNFK